MAKRNRESGLQMTQRRKAAEVKLIPGPAEKIEKGMISVIKFKSINEFVEKVEGVIHDT